MRLSTKHISVVIPAFNERDNLMACLDALAEQTCRPMEIVVVDNNSSDGTGDIARNYGGVRVIHEAEQSIRAAQMAGFNAARGTIIARTDADSRPDPDWLEKIAQTFASTPASAFTGSIYYHDMPASAFSKAAERFIRKQVARHSKGKSFLAGANMAIKKSAWDEVKASLCCGNDIHEDLDLAIHLQKAGKIVTFAPDLLVSTSARRIDTSIKDFYGYIKGMETVFIKHQIKSSLVLKAPLFFYVPAQPVFRFIYKIYNSPANQFALATLNRLLAEI